MSLHRDGSRLGLDPYVVEHRRRLWSYLCHADAKHSLLLGRPLTIDARFYDTELPSNINIDDIVGVTLPTASKPYEEPTFATFLILRHKLADIVFEMISAFQTLRMPMTYTEVQAFDARLQQFRSELPPHYHITQPDKSKDSGKLDECNFSLTSRSCIPRCPPIPFAFRTTAFHYYSPSTVVPQTG